MNQDRLILRDGTSPFTGQYADITQGSVLSWAQLDGNFIYLKGQTIISAESENGNIIFNKLNGESFELPFSGGVSTHNELDGLQGGSPILNEYYHFNGQQYIKILDLIYSDLVTSINVNPTIGERGIIVPVNVGYSITSNDDEITSATINNGIGNVINDVDGGNKTVLGGNFTQSVTFTLSVIYNRNGSAGNENKNTTYTAAIPQWAGVSTNTDFITYSQLNVAGTLQKFIQTSASFSKVSSPVNQYIWFVSNKNNALIQDGNNFTQTTGNWGDGVSEFYRKTVSLTLADGITTVSVYFYRSREIKNLINFTYKIS